MNPRRLHTLEQLYLMALCCMDYYKLQGEDEGLTVGQFACTQGLDFTELEQLREHLTMKGITT